MRRETKNPVKFIIKSYSADLSSLSRFSRVYKNRERIWDMRGIGMPWIEIAQYLNINPKTLKKILKSIEEPSPFSIFFEPDRRFRILLQFIDEAERDWYTKAIEALHYSKSQMDEHNLSSGSAQELDEPGLPGGRDAE